MQEMWKYPIGTVVRFIPTEDHPRALWGHVVGFTETALDQVALLVDWQGGDCLEAVPPLRSRVEAMSERITVMISGWAKNGDHGVNVSGVVQKPVTMPAPPVLKGVGR